MPMLRSVNYAGQVRSLGATLLFQSKRKQPERAFPFWWCILDEVGTWLRENGRQFDQLSYDFCSRTAVV